jgi:hypothetical protein
MFRWNYQRALTERGIPWCTFASPRNGLADVQKNGELVAGAIRDMHQRAGRRITIIGHSQGGLVPRWALKFWPETQPMVDDVIALAAPQHGTDTFRRECEGQGSCPPSNWQLATGSQFLAAVNQPAETVAGISYTNVYTRTDQVVTPIESATLHTGPGAIANLALQDVCPGNVSEHLMVGTQDPVAWALAYDALTHEGPAVAERLPADTCDQFLMPGVNRATYAADFAIAVAELESNVPGSPRVPEEPELACYVTDTCEQPPGCGGRTAVAIPRALHRVRVTVRSRRLRILHRGGRRVVLVPLTSHGRTVRIRGRLPSGRRVVRLRRVKACPLPSRP